MGSENAPELAILSHIHKILRLSEMEKSTICDLQFVCGDSNEKFSSFRLLFAAVSPMLRKSFQEDDDNSVVVFLPHHVKYGDLFRFHEFLLARSFEAYEEPIFADLFKLLGIDKNEDLDKDTEAPKPKPKPKRHAATEKGILVCKECGKEYMNMMCFENHLAFHAQQAGNIINSEVSVSAKTKTRLSSSGRPSRNASYPSRYKDQDLTRDIEDERKRKKTSARVGVCKVCSKSFSSAQSLSNHMRLHDGERPFECETCGKKFVAKAMLVSHKKLHSGIARLFKCEHCGKTFSSNANLVRHVRSVHFEHSDNKVFPCDICAKEFRDPSALKAHTKIHTGQRSHKCESCQKAFLTANQLRIHMRIHTGERPFSCVECGKNFITKAQLDSHKMYRHVGVKLSKNFLCQECGTTFVKAHDLTVHRLKHSGERPYPCEVCTKQFRSVRHLKIHRRTHTGEKPYRCDLCGKQFRTRTGFRSHCKSSNDCVKTVRMEDANTDLLENDGDSHVQAVMFTNEAGEQCFQLEDGQILRPTEATLLDSGDITLMQ